MIVDIPPFLAYIRAEYLHDQKEGQGYFVDATVYALASSVGEPIRAQVMVNNRFILSRLPVSAIANSKTAPRMNEEECVAIPCPDDNVSIITHEYLSSLGQCQALKSNGEIWQNGNYILTIEWPKSRKEMHLIEFDDGNYVILEDEKLNWKV